MTRVVRSCVMAAALAVLIAAFEPVGNASTMIPGDSLSMGSCQLSDNSSYALCAHDLINNGFYGVSWGGVVCSVGLHYVWDSVVDATCSTGYGSHSNQSTSAGSTGFAQMQSDGNFVLYSAPSTARWATNTNGYGSSAFLNLQDDGNLVVYYSFNVAIWSIY